MIKQIVQIINKKLEGDKVLWLCVFILSCFSILVVYSSVSARAFRQSDGNTEVWLGRHFFYVVAAWIAMWFVHRIDYKNFSKWSDVLWLISVVLLVLTMVPGIGVSSNDAARWIKIPLIGITFQPSDLAKLALISNMAALLAKRQKNIDDFKNSVLKVQIKCGIIIGLIALSNFSTAALLGSVSFLMMFFGRVSAKHLGMFLAIGFVAMLLALSFGTRWQTVIGRVQDFIAIQKGETESGVSEIPYQVSRANMAIATGGLTGKGIGNSRQKYFLPEAYADYVFAIFVEEYGLLGGALLVILYLVILYRVLKIMQATTDAFGGLLVIGLGFMLVIQSLAHMAVVVGIGPVTGWPLPFMSMGGTALVFMGVTMGLIISVSHFGVNKNLNENGSAEVL